MRSVSPEQLALIVERLVLAVRPEKIFLFGSQASGEANDFSDIDILVVVPDSDASPRQTYAAAEESLRGTLLPVEMVICSHSAFEKQKDWICSIPNIVLKKGRLLYAA
jgi:uncharacterized protein